MFLQHLPKKKPVIITLIIFVIISGFLGYFFFSRDVGEASAWWNEGWHYRKLIPVTNSGSALTDYQISFTLDTAALITAGKMQSDCDDLRLTDYQGQVLPYWLEENNPGCNNAATRVWTKISSLPSGTTNIFAYYGNPQTTSAQKGSDVFTFFDDFSGTNFDSSKWNLTGTNTITSSVASSGGINNSNYFSSVQSFSTGIVTEFRFKSTGGYGRFGLQTPVTGVMHTGGGATGLIAIQSSGAVKYTDVIGPSANAENNEGATDTNFHKLKFYWNTDLVKWDYDGVTLRSFNTAPYIPAGPLYVKSADLTEVDNIFVRKYTATEPTIGTLGSEEKGLGPVGFWRFDEGQGTTTADATINGNTGTLNGGVSWQDESQCISGKCLYYDGTDDYVSVGVNQFSSTTGSVSIWVRPVTGLSNGSMIFGHQNGNNRLYIGSDAWPRIKLGLADNGAIDSGKDIVYNTWQHLLLTYNSGTWFFYYNGEQVSTGVYTGSITFSVPEIGDDGGSAWTSNFKGFIDEVKVYNYGRTENQIKQDYSAGLAGSGASAGAAAVLGGKNQKWLADGLVGYWKMDEASWTNDCSTGSVVDSSGNSNNGKACPASTGPTGGAVGKFGNGGSFDGSNDSVDISDPASGILDFGSNSFTVSAWVYSNGYSNQGSSWNGILGKGQISGVASNYYGLFINSTNKVYFSVNDDDYIAASQNAINGGWHHVIGVRDGNTLYIYVDGVLNGSGTTSGSVDTAVSLFFGTDGHSARQFNGKVDDVRIYNRALSGQEVADLYSWAPGPVGYWKFDENTGTTAYDSSGNGFNSSSITGSPSWKPGKHGSALDFTGTNKYVTLPIMTAKYGGAVTVSAWVYHTAGTSWDDIVAGGCSDILFGFNGSQLSFGGQCNTPMTAISYATNINDAWHYVTGTYDGSTSKLYVDGIQVASASKSGTFVPSSLQISRTGEDFQGKIDEVKIYNYARTPKQILEDMNSGQGKAVGWWRLDEGQGTTAYNSITGGANGNISNATWTTSGKQSKALSFNGTSSVVTLPYPLGSVGPNQLSITTWFKRTRSGVEEYVVDSDGNESTIRILSNNKVRCEYWNGTAIQYVDSNATVTDTNWHHAACVLDYGNSIKIYLDGQLDNTNSAPSGTLGNGALTNSYIGARGVIAGFFSGLIDEVKMYSYTLTADDVKKDYNQGAATALGIGSESGNTGNGPVAWWKLDDNTGGASVDSSGNGHTATLNSGATWGVGKLGSSLKLDGVDDYVSVSNNAAFNVANVTVSAWVKRTGYNTSICNILRRSSADNFALMCGQSADTVWFRVRTDASTTHDSPTASLPLNEWVHLTGTFDGQYVRIYKNGVLIGSTAAAVSIGYASVNDLIIGRDDAVTGRYFKGYIDDVKIYNYARTQAQVAYDYNRGKPVGHWSLDEGDGTVARDFSGRENNAVLTNMTTASDWVTGKYGKALDFDGTNDYLIVNSSDYRFSSGDFTASIWAKASVLDGSYDGLMTTDTGGDSAWKIYRDAGNNYFKARYGSKILSYPAVSTGEWHMYTMVKSGTTLSIYLDGVFIISDTCPSTHSVVSTSLVFGSYRINDALSGYHMFAGQMDDARIYNYALTADQVKQVMQEASAVRF